MNESRKSSAGSGDPALVIRHEKQGLTMRKSNASRHLTHDDYIRLASKRQRLGGKQGEIMLAARVLFETRGVANTSIKDITTEANITRELFYYYFKNKQAVIDAVFDDFVEDLVESALVWNELREFGDTRGSLRKCMETFRRALQDKDGSPRPMFAVLDELGQRDAFRMRAVEETVGALDTYVVAEYATFHKVEIELVYETFCVLLFGLVGMIRMKPDISTETLMKLVEQVLKLDMNPLPPPSRS